MFRTVPFDTDVRARKVTAPRIYHNWPIGSVPRNGQTGAVRELACAIALDPLAGLWIAELKGNRCSCSVGSSLCCSAGNVIVLAGRSSAELLAFCCSLR